MIKHARILTTWRKGSSCSKASYLDSTVGAFWFIKIFFKITPKPDIVSPHTLALAGVSLTVKQSFKDSLSITIKSRTKRKYTRSF